MLKQLNEQQQKWVNQKLSSMNIEQMVGQLLCPEDRDYTQNEWEEIFSKVPVGSVFFGKIKVPEFSQTLEMIQSIAQTPVLVAADCEQGAGELSKEYGGTNFGYSMTLGAANDEKLAYQFGRAVAKELRRIGIHWTLAPVVDLNINFNNPVTNIRAISDDPRRAIPLLCAIIRGRQENMLVAATAKHFPGDGIDDRDQHLCTSVNSLSFKEWDNIYGEVWREIIAEGVMSIMSGHISLPSFQEESVDQAMPATLCKKLQCDLLRERLGFQGVIISDAASMIGFASRVKYEDMVVENILSGSDVYLFADPYQDYNRLMKAVSSGVLKEQKVYESAKRVLEMKARLNIHLNPFIDELEDGGFKKHKKLANEIAEKSIVSIKNNGIIPLSLDKNAKILTVTLSYENHKREPNELPFIDHDLLTRGFDVDHLFNPKHSELIDISSKYDVIFLNFLITLHMRPGTLRMTGEAIMPLWRAFYKNSPNVVCTSFGNPYVLYEQPHLPNMFLTFSPSEASQRAAVKAWLGEILISQSSPVQQPKIEIKRMKNLCMH